MEMRSLFICVCCLLILLAFAIGLISGLVIIKVEDMVEDGHRENLLILYNVED
jgi:hypothetical protein